MNPRYFRNIRPFYPLANYNFVNLPPIVSIIIFISRDAPLETTERKLKLKDCVGSSFPPFPGLLHSLSVFLSTSRLDRQRVHRVREELCLHAKPHYRSALYRLTEEAAYGAGSYLSFSHLKIFAEACNYCDSFL